MNFLTICALLCLGNHLATADYDYDYSLRPGEEPYAMMGNAMDWMAGNSGEYMRYLQPNEVGRDRKYDDMSMNDGCLCTRDCCKYPEPRICYYKFYVEQYSAMGPACRDCAYGNISDCFQHQCVQSDGIEKTVFTVNRKLPGPLIDVCYGDRVVVDVMNQCTSMGVTFHWHGLHQKDTPYMDGVPYLTQCPIQAMGQFRYNFSADTIGTHFYHSHLGNLPRDGVIGGLVIRDCDGPNAHLYDWDLPSHVINVMDLFHFPTDAFWPGYYRAPEQYVVIRPVGTIINGQGSYRNQTSTPHAKFYVKSGYRYRMRLITGLFGNCGMYFAIQGHNMTVIAVDGYSVKPVVVQTLFCPSAYRVDFVIDTRGKPKGKSYYMVVKLSGECQNTTTAQDATLIYEDYGAQQAQAPQPYNISTIYTGPYLDNLALDCQNTTNVCSSELTTLEAKVDPRLTCGEPDYQFYMDIGFYTYAYDELFDNPDMPAQFFYLPIGGGPPGSNFTGAIIDTLMNNISSTMPPCPLLTERCPMSENMICRNGKCDSNYCRCVNILEVELNSIVDMVFRDHIGQPHPMHLHGHGFTVLYQGTAQELLQANYTEKGLCARKDPCIRDTVAVPPDGFLKIRFKANNPGYWLMHCHFSDHHEAGMFVIFKVGQRKEFVPIPKNFPKCGPYLPALEGVAKATGSARCAKKCDGDSCSKCYKQTYQHMMGRMHTGQNNYETGVKMMELKSMSTTYKSL